MIAALEPCFAPVEQRQPAADRPLGPWTDLYALAGTLRFCITGEVPAPPAGDAPQRPPEPLAALWQAGHAADSKPAPVPAWLAAFDACLAQRARDRPQSVAQLRAMLVRLDAAWQCAPKARPAQLMLPGSDAEPAVALAPKASPVAPALDVADTQTSPPPLAAPTHAAPTTAPEAAAQGMPLRAPPRQGRRQWLRGGVALLLVLGASAGAWLWKQGASAVPAASAPSAAAARPAPAKPAAMPSDTADLVPPTAAAAKPTAAAGPVATPLPAPRAPVPAAATATRAQDSGAPRAAAKPVAAPTGTAPSAQRPAGTSRPVASAGTSAAAKAAPAARPAAPRADKAKAAPNASPAAKAPRALCAGRTRYALLQCMQDQCAKREWSRHEQCVRLRTERKLS
jgi:hypothetical protein